VLLRLSAPAFDFSQALDSGQDIRFTKEDGTPLPYEIERWDRSSAQAAIWVLIDTVYGNSSTQTFVMQWGNASAASRSNAAAVFDTANGFAGVWHLGERGDGSQGEYIDATVDGNNGTSQGTSAPSAADGIAGLSQHLDNSYIEVSDNPTLEPPANMSLQAWVRLDSISSVEGKDFFVAEQFDQHLQWNSYYLRVFSAFQTVQFVWRSTDTTVLDAIGSTKLTAGTWYHLGVVKVDTLISVFVNGIDETAYRSKANSAFYISSKRSFSIGSENNLGDPGGTIDELQVSRVARSAAWMKLAFENQRQPGTLVRFGQ
jgi:biopolymer transport protein ExbB